MVASASCLFALRACADTVNVPVQAVDQDGQPVAKALVESDSRDKKLSDENGKAFLEVKKRAFYNRFYAEKEGYYPTATDGEHSPLAKDFNPSKLIKIQLKKIKNPIPMFAKDLRHVGFGKVQVPVVNEEVGYDLMAGDWVAPHGKGKVADFIFRHQGVTRWSGPKYYKEEYEQIITISFPNNHDGIIAWEGASEAGRTYGSELVSGYEAPKEGYQETWVQRTWKEKGGYHQTTSNMDRNFYFRVRTKVDENGNIISAHYGKIYGDFMSFIYYLNPTPNDRNIEFDPKRNLLPDGNVQRP